MSFKSLSIVAASALVLCAGAAQAVPLVPVELVVNGGFETGGFSGWQQFFIAPGEQTIVTTPPPSNVASGSYAARMNHSYGFGYASLIKSANQGAALPLVAGEEVTITFDAKGSFAEGGVAFAEIFSEKAGGGTNPPGKLFEIHPSINPDTYTTLSFKYNVSNFGGAAGGLTLQFAGITGGAPGSSADLYLDNVSMTVMRPVPEPGTYALMLAGLVGVGAIARRRRAA